MYDKYDEGYNDGLKDGKASREPEIAERDERLKEKDKEIENWKLIVGDLHNRLKIFEQ